MFPVIEIGSEGEAFILYTHDPVPGSTTAEDGDIRFVSSLSAPYNAWSMPTTVSDDSSGKAQGFPALVIGNGGQLIAMWEDHRLSSDNNLFYDCFSSQKTRGSDWFSNIRVSDDSSISDFIFIGDYLDLTLTNTNVFGIWTDRSEMSSIFDLEDNVYGSLIIASGRPRD